MKLREIASCALTLMLVACGSPELDACPALQLYVPEQAAADATRAKAQGERYLLGVYGFTTEVPGQVDGNLPVRMIEGTSDARCPEQNSRVREYARLFNASMQQRR